MRFLCGAGCYPARRLPTVANRRSAGGFPLPGGLSSHVNLPRNCTFHGRPIQVSFRRDLTAWRGKLLSRDARGHAVLAASFLRKRRIVLDRSLLDDNNELRRILLHEIFHFVWARLGNPARREWEQLLETELAAKAAGEVGWSAEWRKAALRPLDVKGRTRRWRQYACESFCDTAGWLFTQAARHPELTLRAAERKRRQRWFERLLARRSATLPI